MKRFTKDHEWIEDTDGVLTVGISDHAQEQLGDITFVELPDVGKTLAKGDAFAVVESVKAASDVYAPVDGEVVEVNAALDEKPELVNEAPESDGWFVKFKAEGVDLSDLMDQAGYDEYLKTIS
ncbi:glycine cleavage system protein GcvH [Acuticoccus sp. I52.16.1]|uniref:glycine cleavage system protein GcvH n=1 Tax=Acuticoccus sp. I52.16.1 TaxID=2928472 RepID=UPI001FCFA82A|nr:glycine cleavage system protein GcvH [Acuticoccus sp. I52.16.1]UOM34775.1 glycine cleavage system protein GcvH [Acuticoccus sp. I52.16.1]